MMQEIEATFRRLAVLSKVPQAIYAYNVEAEKLLGMIGNHDGPRHRYTARLLHHMVCQAAWMSDYLDGLCKAKKMI